MTDKTPSPPPVRLAMALLTPAAEDLEDDEPAATPDPAGDTRFHDPYLVLAQVERPWVEVDIEEGRTRIDLPYKDPDELYELLETLYLLGGWKAVDAACKGAELALVFAVRTIVDPSAPPIRDAVYFVARGLDMNYLLARARTRPWPLVLAGLQAVVTIDGVLRVDPMDLTRSVPSVSNPEITARLYADVVLALARARRRLASRILGALRRTEQEAKRLLRVALSDAKADICRETIRYFTLQKESVEAALNQLHSLYVATDEKSTQGKNGKNAPVAEQPKELQDALKKLIPFAEKVLKLLPAKKQPGLPPTPSKAMDTLLAAARASLAREVGRLAQAYPILSQIDETGVKRAQEAKAALLGRILFGILTRAYAANRSIRVRTDRFIDLTAALANARHPEDELAAKVKKAAKDTVWSYTKYVERAVARAGEGDDVTRKALANTLAALGVESAEIDKALVQGAAEMFLLQTTERFAKRLVPVANVAQAAWHIAVAIKEFKEQHDEFYCALDPRDALVPAAPSTAGLVWDIATEAAFALV